jgi:hypothetical protein
MKKKVKDGSSKLKKLEKKLAGGDADKSKPAGKKKKFPF